MTRCDESLVNPRSLGSTRKPGDRRDAARSASMRVAHGFSPWKCGSLLPPLEENRCCSGIEDKGAISRRRRRGESLLNPVRPEAGGLNSLDLFSGVADRATIAGESTSAFHLGCKHGDISSERPFGKSTTWKARSWEEKIFQSHDFGES